LDIAREFLIIPLLRPIFAIQATFDSNASDLLSDGMLCEDCKKNLRKDDMIDDDDANDASNTPDYLVVVCEHLLSATTENLHLVLCGRIPPHVGIHQCVREKFLCLFEMFQKVFQSSSALKAAVKEIVASIFARTEDFGFELSAEVLLQTSVAFALRHEQGDVHIGCGPNGGVELRHRYASTVNKKQTGGIFVEMGVSTGQKQERETELKASAELTKCAKGDMPGSIFLWSLQQVTSSYSRDDNDSDLSAFDLRISLSTASTTANKQQTDHKHVELTKLEALRACTVFAEELGAQCIQNASQVLSTVQSILQWHACEVMTARELVGDASDEQSSDEMICLCLSLTCLVTMDMVEVKQGDDRALAVGILLHEYWFQFFFGFHKWLFICFCFCFCFCFCCCCSAVDISTCQTIDCTSGATNI
jgi:hypothetical protein